MLRAGRALVVAAFAHWDPIQPGTIGAGSARRFCGSTSVTRLYAGRRS
jgi:hypothetical protein